MTTAQPRICTGAAIAAALAAFSCTPPRVTLERPAAGASFEERRARYEQLRPAAHAREIVVHSGVNGSSSVSTDDSMVLVGGQTVRDPRDLLPVVRRGSVTGNAIDRYSSARRTANIGGTIAGIGLAVAAVSFASGAIMHGDAETGDPEFKEQFTHFWPGVAVGAIGAGIGTVVAVRASAQAKDARTAAFTTYEASLREELDLCLEGTRVVECSAEGTRTAATASGGAAPAAGSGCQEFTAFSVDVLYQGTCAGPRRIYVDYDPAVQKRIDLSASSFDPKRENLQAISFAPEGCKAELAYRGPSGELRFHYEAVETDRIAGAGTFTAANGDSCPVEIKGSRMTWSRKGSKPTQPPVAAPPPQPVPPAAPAGPPPPPPSE